MDEKPLAEGKSARRITAQQVCPLWDSRLNAPEDLRNVSLCTFEEGNLTWDAGVRLTQSVKGFRNAAA